MLYASLFLWNNYLIRYKYLIFMIILTFYLLLNLQQLINLSVNSDFICLYKIHLSDANKITISNRLYKLDLIGF